MTKPKTPESGMLIVTPRLAAMETPLPKPSPMDGIDAFVEASTRRSELVGRLRDMLDASVPVPIESPPTPTKDLGFAKGFREREAQGGRSGEPADPELWSSLYKDLWRPSDGEEYTLANPTSNGNTTYEIVTPDDDGFEENGFDAYSFDMHQTALNFAFDGEWQEALTAFTTFALQDSQGTRRPVDYARAWFNCGVLEFALEDEERKRVARVVAKGHFNQVLEKLADNDKWQSEPVLLDAKARHAKLVEEIDRVWDEHSANAKALETEAEAFSNKKDFDNAIAAWERCENAWLSAGTMRDAADGDDVEYHEEDVKGFVLSVRAKAAEAKKMRDNPKGKKKK